MLSLENRETAIFQKAHGLWPGVAIKKLRFFDLAASPAKSKTHQLCALCVSVVNANNLVLFLIMRLY
jgi:hypothetical protein